MSRKTYSLEEVAADLCGDSMKDPVRWLYRQISAGRVTARKIGRHLRMTDEDVAAALEVFRIGSTTTEPEPAADEVPMLRLTSASRARRTA